AAIGSQALNYARQHKLDKDLIQHGTTVLNVSVLSIMLTAPLGAVLIGMLGPVMLEQDVIPSDIDETYEVDDAFEDRVEEEVSAATLVTPIGGPKQHLEPSSSLVSGNWPFLMHCTGTSFLKTAANHSPI
ncbi:hypothetical protein CEXT_420551, partial [Caerostris extrusa]